MLFSKIEKIVEGKVLKLKADRIVEFLITDSRKVFVHPNALFIAIQGPRHDGHKYIEELYNKGITQFIIEKESYFSSIKYPNANFILVENALNALQKMAAYHRRKFSLEVLAITGSNGKTIIKEWLSQLLANEYSIVKSPKSYNSQLGVPLSVWETNETHQLGIFEAGISKPDEMQKLEEIIRPTLGLITNLGSAHDEGFENPEQKLAEKCKLFAHCNAVFYCHDHTSIHSYLNKTFDNNYLFSWSAKYTEADLFVEKIVKDSASAACLLRFKGFHFEVTLPFVDDASIENSLHCVLIMLYFSIPFDEIKIRLSTLKKVSMRLELKQGINNCYIIDDTYNNDLAGLEIAIDFLIHQNQRPKKTLILSDLLESGVHEGELYQNISDLLQQKGISKLVGIGPKISRHRHLFKLEKVFFENTQSFLQNGDLQSFDEEIILVKGARVFTFERIIQALQQKIHGTLLEINLDALSNNLNFYRSRLNPTTKLMVMVKAFAYGSGSNEVANLLQFHRVDYLAVAYPDEGVSLRKSGITLPIMVMNPTADAFEKMLEYQLEPEIYSPVILSRLVSYLKGNDKSAKIHLEVETGMRRLGFEKEHLSDLFNILKENPQIQVASVFSHLAGSDEEALNDFSNQQIATFKELSTFIESELNYPVIKHLLNSPGIIRFPEAQFDMVRLGIGLYGVEVNERFQNELQSISTLKTTVSQIKDLKTGETVGYGRRGQTIRDTRIATIAIGYADGFNRAFSRGKGKVMINGKLAPVIGNVCMDMTMIDVTDIEAKEGDEVIIFGKDLPISQMARWIDTIPYEILTNISERVKRVYYTE